MLTQAELQSQLHYNQDTGIFTRLISYSNKSKVGDVAGSLTLGYIIISINNKPYRAHRLVWLYVYGAFPENMIDHINRVKSDNRLCNLRIATRRENAINSKIRSNNSSGFKGVFFCSRSKKWIARSANYGKQFHLGTFTNPEDASAVYQEFVLKNHGEFLPLPKLNAVRTSGHA